jgi:hypothetical protein
MSITLRHPSPCVKGIIPQVCYISPMAERTANSLRNGKLIFEPSLFVVIFGGGAAIYAWPGFRTLIHPCGEHTIGTGRIDDAIGLVLLASVLGLIGLILARTHLRTLTLIQLAVGLAYAASIALVWSTAADYEKAWVADPGAGDMFNCSTSGWSMQSVSYLYPVWGAVIALLFLQAVRAFAFSRVAPTEAEQKESEERE